MLNHLALTLLLTSGAVFADERAETASCNAVVLYRSGSDAYQEAVDGIRESLKGSPYKVEYVDQAAPVRHSCLNESPKLITAIGLGSWDVASHAAHGAIVLPAIVLHGDVKAHGTDAVYADVPITAIAERLREAFPGKSRLGLIHKASRPSPSAAVLAHLKQMNFELLVAECPGPEKLLAVFNSLKGKVDFVITEPDSDLYNSATLKPLVMASLDSRLPMVGFSAAFVRAGALTGVYPDFRELGRQTGECMLRMLAGKSGGEDGPRAFVIAVNERIVRLIGLEPQSGAAVVTFK